MDGNVGEKQPSFQFYPGDWQKDPALRRTSKAAKGVWMDLLCLMFECEERGVLVLNGKAWSDDEIAWAVGGDQAENLRCLAELIDKGVARRRKDGAVCSDRMVRDEAKRKAAKEAGILGGNPQLVKGMVNGRVKRFPTPQVNQNPTPSSSSSASSSKQQTPLAPNNGAAANGHYPNGETDLQRIVKGWKLLNAIPVDGPESSAWDRVHFARHAKSAKALLDLFGSRVDALRCMELVHGEMTKKKLTCTIETVVKHSDLYREKLSKQGVA